MIKKIDFLKVIQLANKNNIHKKSITVRMN